MWRSARAARWIGAVVAGLATAGCTPRAAPPPAPANTLTSAVVDIDAVRPQVEQFCGNCHATPQPASFPQDRWPHEVERGYEFYLLSGRSDLAPPRRSDVMAYYRQLAPQRLPVAAAPVASGPAQFARRDLSWPLPPGPATGVAHILALPGSATPGTSELLACDMRSGLLTWASPGATDWEILRQVQLVNPDHVCQTDLDADGQADFLVCDLGSFLPEDHSRGRVVWLRPRSGELGQDVEQIVLLDGVGRVADAQAADFDGDGDLDIVAAVFGWHSTGGVLLLRNQGLKAGQPQFEREVLDERDGAIHVPIADLNVDGRPDFVVLFAQEHESVEAFLSRPDGQFDKLVLYRAPDPSYGSSGIQLVDLDGDADWDVLYTNGDTFDSYYVKPYHGIRWIENRGSAGWQDRLLANLPGVHRALAGDLDGDGDLDIAACSFVSSQSLERQPEITRLSSLVWLEQAEGEFTLHEIEADNAVHAALELADVNGDGALDIVAGSFGQAATEADSPLSVWINQPTRQSPPE